MSPGQAERDAKRRETVWAYALDGTLRTAAVTIQRYLSLAHQFNTSVLTRLSMCVTQTESLYLPSQEPGRIRGLCPNLDLRVQVSQCRDIEGIYMMVENIVAYMVRDNGVERSRGAALEAGLRQCYTKSRELHSATPWGDTLTSHALYEACSSLEVCTDVIDATINFRGHGVSNIDCPQPDCYLQGRQCSH
jgi:hypothetical protein